MKKNILLSLLILFSIQVMSQEKGAHISIWGGAGPTGFTYKMEGIDFAKPNCDILLGGQAGLGFSYYFTKHVGITIGVDMAHYRTKAVLSGEFLKDKYFILGTFTDNDPLPAHTNEYELRVRTRNWTEYQSGKLLEIPLMINFQKKFGEREYFGLYLAIGAKFQLPLIVDYSIVNGDNKDDAKLMVSGFYKGINPEDNLELGGFGGVGLPQHGFDKIHNPSEVLSGATGKLNLKFNISAVAEAGILISLSRRVDISLGAFIDYGLMDMNRKKSTTTAEMPPPLFSIHSDDYVAGAENNVGYGITYNSILNSAAGDSRYVNKISTFSYGGKVGLRIKLGKLAQKQQPQVVFAPCDKDTVYIYKIESQPIEIDSLIKELKDALKDMPRYTKEADENDDTEEYIPAHIPAEDIEILYGPIYFDLDKAILTPKSIIDLDKKVKILNKYPEMKLIIFGNTCDLGNDPYNYKLGQRRAEAARDYLISKGISADRLDSSTLSRFQPEAPNTNEPNRMHNRRDDFKPMYPKK